MNDTDYEINYNALAGDLMALDSKHKAMVKQIAEIVGADPDEDLAVEVERYAKRLRAEKAAAVQTEREACAKVAEGREKKYTAHDMFPAYGMDGLASEAHDIAAAIRARS